MTWAMEKPAVAVAERLTTEEHQLPPEVMRLADDTAAIVVEVDGVDYILTMARVTALRRRRTLGESNEGAMGSESEFMDGFREAAKTDAQEFKRLNARIAELEALVYVPGLWRCAKCKFQLVQAVLSASTGAVHSHDKPGEKCPNCAGPLWRVTERQAGNDMADRCEQAVLRNLGLEAALLEYHRWHLDYGGDADGYLDSALFEQAVAAMPSLQNATKT